jgi:hypothetical protein
MICVFITVGDDSLTSPAFLNIYFLLNKMVKSPYHSENLAKICECYEIRKRINWGGQNHSNETREFKIAQLKN